MINNNQTALSTINEENESELSTLTTQSGNCYDEFEELSTTNADEQSNTSISKQSKTFSVDSNASSFQCFRDIIMSSSSVFQNPFYYFPDLKDPGIQEALDAIDEEQPIEDTGCRAYKEMCKTLEIFPISKVCKSLNTKQLNLKYYVPCEKQMRAICKTLENNTFIQELNLQDNWLSPESCAYLASVLELNTTLKILKMKECRIGAEGMAALSEALETSSIQVLDLSFNSLEDEGLKIGKTALSANVNLTKLNLSHNEFTEDAAVYLYDILVEAYSLVELDLSWNCFNTPKCTKQLCQGLIENKTLQRLNLAWNGIASQETVFPFVRYLRRSATLTFLDLSNNLIGGASLDIIMKGVAASRSLEHLKIGNNIFSPQKAYKCAEILARARNKPLKLIDIENMVVQKRFLKLMERIRERGNNVIYGAVLADYEIHGPYIPKVLFGRCKYLGMKPKKKKKRVDFGHFVLSLPQQPISPQEFLAALAARKLTTLLDSNLIAAVIDHYMMNNKKSQIDCSQLVNDYLVLYPDTQPEPPRKRKLLKEKKSTKRSKKGKKVSDSQGTPKLNGEKDMKTKQKEGIETIGSTTQKSMIKEGSRTKITGSKSSLKHSSTILRNKVSHENLEEKQEENLMNVLNSTPAESQKPESNALNASGVFFLE